MNEIVDTSGYDLRRRRRRRSSADELEFQPPPSPEGDSNGDRRQSSADAEDVPSPSLGDEHLALLTTVSGPPVPITASASKNDEHSTVDKHRPNVSNRDGDDDDEDEDEGEEEGEEVGMRRRLNDRRRRRPVKSERGPAAAVGRKKRSTWMLDDENDNEDDRVRADVGRVRVEKFALEELMDRAKRLIDDWSTADQTVQRLSRETEDDQTDVNISRVNS